MTRRCRVFDHWTGRTPGLTTDRECVRHAVVVPVRLMAAGTSPKTWWCSARLTAVEHHPVLSPPLGQPSFARPLMEPGWQRRSPYGRVSPPTEFITTTKTDARSPARTMNFVTMN